jgi:hypothetical protein
VIHVLTVKRVSVAESASWGVREAHPSIADALGAFVARGSLAILGDAEVNGLSDQTVGGDE